MRPRRERGRDAEHDVAVIGSGFAGTAVARRLVDGGARVLLLEAGGPFDPSMPNDGAGAMFPVREDGDAVPPTADNRAIEIGGTARRWNGVCTRLLPDDLDTGSRYGYGTDWPFAGEVLTTFYEEAERRLHVHGAPFVLGAEPARVPYPVERRPTAAPAVFGDRLSFPLAFGSREGAPIRLAEVEVPALAASCILVPASPVLRLATDRRGGVVGVEAVGAHGEAMLHRARHVVVAAGVVETVRILLSSVSPRHPDGVGNRHGLVGRGLHGHPRLRGTIARPESDADVRGVHRTYQPGFVTRQAGLGALALDVNADTADLVVTVTAEFEPSSASLVSLDPSTRDRWGRPAVRIDARRTDRDRATFAAAEALLRESGVTGPTELTWFHPAGACRMGRSPADGVADGVGTLFDAPNVHLAGAAMFPTSGPTNPTLTVVALALRTAEHVLQVLR